jgi:hypothetical protein
LRRVKTFEVHDETGKLRVFWTQQEADRFAGEEYRVVQAWEPRVPRPVIDLDRFEPAPF